MKNKLLVFHPALAPYRIDLFNSLHKSFESEFVFFREHLISQKFDKDVLHAQLEFKPTYMTKGLELNKKGQMIRFGIFKKILKNKPNIILCSEFSVLTLYIIIISKILLPNTRIYSICDDSIDVASKSGKFRNIARLIAVKLLNGLILASDAANEWYNKNYPKVKTIVFPIIQHEERIKKISENSIEPAKNFVKHYNLTNKKVFLFIGRLVEVKNLFFLIKVFAKYIEKNDNSVLILVGDGDLKNDLLDFTKQLNVADKVIFPGRFENEELYAWYNISDFFILPSTSETFGAVVNEALVMGVHVFCSELAGAACLINNENGGLFNPYNEESLLNLFYKTDNSIIDIYTKKKYRNSLMNFDFENKVNQLINFIAK